MGFSVALLVRPPTVLTRIAACPIDSSIVWLRLVVLDSRVPDRRSTYTGRSKVRNRVAEGAARGVESSIPCQLPSEVPWPVGSPALNRKSLSANEVIAAAEARVIWPSCRLTAVTVVVPVRGEDGSGL